MPPLTGMDEDLTVDDAYAIQRSLTELMAPSFGNVVGWKIGLTSSAMQDMLGVAEPDFGALLEGMTSPSGVKLSLSDFIEPRVEMELALVLGEPLRGPRVTPLDVLEATKEVCIALEIIDSRIKDWDLRLVDTVADLASCGHVVVGRSGSHADHMHQLRDAKGELKVNGTKVADGVGSNSMGDPLVAAAWLVNALARYGHDVQADHIILTGALHAALSPQSGDHFVATFQGIGEVSVTFDSGGFTASSGNATPELGSNTDDRSTTALGDAN